MPTNKSDFELDLHRVDEAAARSHALDFPRTRISDVIEGGLGALSWVINWLWAILMLIIVANVTMRYVLRVNYIWIEEVQWHIYAVGFMIGIGYAILHDAHVRVDVLATTFRPRTRAWIEFLSILLLIFPMVYLIIAYALPFVEASYTRGETSSAPGGLANRWAIKGVIVIAFAYIGLAALARFLRVSALLFGLPRPRTG
jgi:TRAP-type mannitol/chloroaromatic compound transport system permease small subunit